MTAQVKASPGQTAGQRFRPEHEMQHPSSAGARRLRRGMQNQRAHEESVAARSGNGDALRPPQRSCPRRIDASQFVRARNDFQRAVRERAGIDVDPHRKQLCEHAVRGLDEMGALLLAPTGKQRVLDPCGDWNAQILMDGDQPVPGGRFFEDAALDRTRSVGKRSPHDWMSHHLLGQGCAPCLVHQSPRPRADCRQPFEGVRNLIAFLLVQQSLDKGDAVGGKLHSSAQACRHRPSLARARLANAMPRQASAEQRARRGAGPRFAFARARSPSHLNASSTAGP
jgi:hypothetical protein